MPLVSYAIASFNSRHFLAQAVQSALAQHGVAVEVLIVDDHSSDGSDALAEALARSDSRVRFFRTPENSGPSGARNVALAEARGTWFAVLDSDDLLHPDRTALLLAEAEASGADMIADDLLLFDDNRRAPPRLFLDRVRARAASWIGLPDYLEETRMFGRRPNLGFLKPMFRREFLQKAGIAYDPALRIAEDDALAIRCLRAGARYRLMPQALYYYRKHGASVTVRLGTGPADAMKAANDRLLGELAGQGGRTARAMRQRASAMTRAWAFTHVIEALRSRDFAGAAAKTLRNPGALRLAHQPVAARLRRLVRSLEPTMLQAASGRVALIVSKQRLVGPINGSSSYLLAIAGELRRAGWQVHLVHPSTSMFGRTPLYRLGPGMGVFVNISAPESWRLGDWLVARKPAIWGAAVRGVAARLLAQFRLGALLPEHKAPWAVGTPWRREDLEFVAGCAGLRPRLVLADYVFCTEAFPALCDPDARTITVMHDRFSARRTQFVTGGDSVGSLTEAEEAHLLARADAILAIQPQEADFARGVAPAAEVLHVPMPAAPVDCATAGEDDRLLFVGSDTAPNVIGLGWFLDEVWPQLLGARSTLRLDVAGSVRNALRGSWPGVTFHGVVPDLAEHYRRAGIVLSPLFQGSGLKIKLVDALAQGKACVVTPVTLQGVEWLASEGAVREARTAPEFVQAILELAQDRIARDTLAATALRAAQRHFGPDAAFAGLREWLVTAIPSKN